MTSFWQEKITIGSFSIPRFMAAPLDGVTDSPLRQLIREFSPDIMLYTEMRHVAAVVNEKTDHSLKYKSIEHPLVFQFSANSERFVDEAVEKVHNAGFDMINLNLGCPARAVVKSGSGSALMENIPLLKIVVKSLRKASEGKLSFTAKIRAGYKKKTAVEVARVLEDLGVEALAIHPRTAPEKFTSRLDFDLVKQVKAALKIPLIFSGNVNNFARAQKTYELTGVDGFMIGRALWGCPWKVREIMDESEGEEFSISLKESLRYACKHLKLNFEHYGLVRGFNMFKKQLPQYIRGIENAAEMRKKLLLLQSPEEMEDQLNALYEQYSTDRSCP